MSSIDVQGQKFVTESVAQLIEFDFRSIGGSARVFIGNELEGSFASYNKIDVIWDGSSRTFEHVDFTLSDLRSDLTGQVTEPTLTVAADTLWQISDWSSATSSLNLMDYRGLKMVRERKFYNIADTFLQQIMFVKEVTELTPNHITFTLTPSLGTESGDKPSARKLNLYT